jgi:2'-5' RNA ligase
MRNDERKYSLWLLPEGDIFEKLNALISGLASKYDAPPFEPHITLLGGLRGPEQKIIPATALLAAALESFSVTLTHLEYRDMYYMCLFVLLEKTRDVMDAHFLAQKILDTFIARENIEFIPHLSLMYGDFPVPLKKEIIKDIGAEMNLSFTVNSIYLFSTDGGPGDWHRFKEFPLA